jgi:LEA14-like dessication related protein
LTVTGSAEQPDLSVNAVSIGDGKTLHMWTIIDLQPSSASATRMTYKVYASNYKDWIFDHWNDGNKQDQDADNQ